MSEPRDGRGRVYSEEERVRGIGTALAIGQNKAADMLGVPRQTIQQWLHTPLAATMREKFQEELGVELWSAFRLALDRTMELLADPNANLRDVGVVLGVVADRAILLSGGATSRSQSMNVNVTVDPDPSGYLRQYDVTQYEQKILAMLDRGTPEDLDALEHEAGLLLSAERELVRVIDAGEASDPIEAMKIIVMNEGSPDDG